LPSGDLADAKNTMRSYSVAAAVTTAGMAAATNVPTGTAAARVHRDGGATDKNKLQSSSSSGPERVDRVTTAMAVPTRHATVAPSNNPAPPFPPLAHVQQEHLLVATVVPDSVLNTTNSGSSSSHQAAAEAPVRWCKPQNLLLGIIALLLLVLVVIGGVCGTGGCSASSSSTATSPTPIPPTVTATMVPAPSPKAQTVTDGAPMADTTNATSTVAMAPPTVSPLSFTMDPTPTTTLTPVTLSPTNSLLLPTAPLPTDTPAMAPRAQQVVAFINDITLTGRMLALAPTANDTVSMEPEELALHWLVYYDTDLNLLPNTPTNHFCLQQRYALAILRVQRDDVNPFFGSTGSECDWAGVTCQSVNLGDKIGIQQAVTEIDTDIQSFTMSGRLSADLGLLTHLQTLDVSDNALAGSLPSQIGQWTNLTYLDVSDNALTGSLPSQIGQWTNLTYLDVSDNALTGSLPSQIGQWTNLTYLDVSDNALTGSLPSQIGQWTNLQYLDVSNNALTGRLPSQIGQWTNLQSLYIYDNTLTGSLPSQIGQWTNVQSLYVSNNNFVGTMPESVCLLRNKSLSSLIADCVSEVSCNVDCCTICF
jgi:Leucine-rich repeat (LRR) protein